MKYFNENGKTIITEGEKDNFSHTNQYAIDLINNIIAPCDMKMVSYTREGGGLQIYWESVNKEKLANGKTDYISILTDHCDSDYNKGDIVKKGKKMVNLNDIGASGSVHCHLQTGIGKINKDLIGTWNSVKTNSGTMLYSKAIKQVSATQLFYKPENIETKYGAIAPNFKKESTMNVKHYLKVFLDKTEDVRYYRKNSNRYILECVNPVNVYFDKEMTKRIDTKMFEPGQKIETTGAGYNGWRKNKDGKNVRYYMHHLQENQHGVDLWIPYKKEEK